MNNKEITLRDPQSFMEEGHEPLRLHAEKVTLRFEESLVYENGEWRVVGGGDTTTGADE